MKVQRRIGALKQRQELQGEGSRARGLGCSGPAQEGATSQVTTVGESASKHSSEVAFTALELERSEHIAQFKSDPATLRMGLSMSAVAFALGVSLSTYYRVSGRLLAADSHTRDPRD
jgi:hypothetical protein